MSAQRGGAWTPSLAVILGFLPLIMGLGAWALSNSNQQAVTDSAVKDLKAETRENEERIERLEVQLAAQRCR